VPLEYQAQGTSLFSSGTSSRRGYPKGIRPKGPCLVSRVSEDQEHRRQSWGFGVATSTQILGWESWGCYNVNDYEMKHFSKW